MEKEVLGRKFCIDLHLLFTGRVGMAGEGSDMNRIDDSVRFSVKFFFNPSPSRDLIIFRKMYPLPILRDY